MPRIDLKVLWFCLALVALSVRPAAAQAIPSSGRFSLFASFSEREAANGNTTTFSELIGTFSLYSESRPDGIFEFGLDTRVATYPSSENRDERISIYEAWVGLRSRNGRWTLRLGQQWLHELGGLGSVGGLFTEYRTRSSSGLGRFRFGLFAGGEPEIRDASYVDNVLKGGVYVAVDGGGGRRHVLGWTLIRNDSLTERSVVTFSNFIPVNRAFFLYQALEYDLEGPGGMGSSELTYFFTNLRWAPTRLVQIQGTYHRGRSIDSRSITDDMLDGRPVAPDRLAGLLFESGRMRLTISPLRRLRFWVGYGRDRNNRDEDWNDRTDYGVWISDIGGSGFDLRASNATVNRGDSTYDNMYVSLGKGLGPKVYVSLDYITSLSIFHYSAGDGAVIEVRPESQRYGLSMNVNLNRTFSLLLTGEMMNHDDFDEMRVLTGLTVRF